VVDKIIIYVEKHEKIMSVINHYFEYICSETLATEILFQSNNGSPVEIDEEINITITIERNKV
jgi:hypothetical protein